MNFIKLFWASAAILLTTAGSLFAQVEPHNCKFKVTPDMRYINAAAQWPAMQGGDTLCVQAGERDRLYIFNVKGAPGKPVTIINCGGKVTFDSHTKEGAFSVVGSQYFRITGTGSPDHKYGFFIRTNVVGSSMHITESDFEVDHVEVGDAGFAGMMSKIEPACDKPEYWQGNFVMQNISYHDNYIHDTGGEGFYVGSSWYTGKSKECGTLYPHEIHNVKIYNNLIEHTDADGIQLSCATKGAEIYDNVIRNYGMDPFKPVHSIGMILGGGTSAKVYNNKILSGGGPGIASFGIANTQIINNLLYRTGSHAIFLDERSEIPSGHNFLVANNTIIEPGRDGIRLYSRNTVGNRFVNNIVTSPSYNPKDEFTYDYTYVIKGAAATIENNLFKKTNAEVGFVNPATGNYELLASSPAIDQGIALPEVTVDLLYQNRPYNGKPDMGAYEFIGAALPQNILPKVFAGDDILTNTNQTQLTLKGAASDADGNIVSTVWTQTAGEPAAIAAPNSLTTTVSSLKEGVYKFTLAATDDVGAVVKDEVTITVEGITEVVETTPRTNGNPSRYLVNFNKDNNQAAPWNNFDENPDPNDALRNISNENGQASAITLTLKTPWGWAATGNSGYDAKGATTGNNSGAVPDNVLMTGFWTERTEAEVIEISGLDTKMAYTLSMIGSRITTGDRTTLYVVGTDTVSLNAANNTQNMVALEEVKPNANGVIELRVIKAASAMVGYLNALIIDEIQTKVVLNPATALAVTGVTQNAATLNWADTNTEEEGYNVYVSENGGEFTLYTTASVNQTRTAINNLLPETNYTVKVEAFASDVVVSSEEYSFNTYKNISGILVNFNKSYSVGSPWNEFNESPDAGDQLVNLMDTEGQATNINVVLNTRWGWENSVGGGNNASGAVTGNESGVYPDLVMRTSFWTQRTEGEELEINGLEAGRKYTFTFFASRKGTGNRITHYSIDGDSVSLNASDNVNNTASLYNVVANKEGKVTININKDAGAEFGYLNAMEIVPAGATTTKTSTTESYQATSLEQSIEAFKVYPNPAASYVVLGFDEQEIGNSLTLQIIDLSGQVRYTKNYTVESTSSDVRVELAELGLASGMYIMNVINSTTQETTPIRFMIR